MTKLHWKTIHTSQQNVKEFKIHNIVYSGWIKTVLNNHQINDLILLKQNENANECKRMHDEHVKKTQQEYKPIPLDQQSRQRRGQAVEGIDEHDYRVDLRTGWRFKKAESQGDEKLEFLAFFAVRELVILSEFRTNFGCREINCPMTDGRCDQNTHSHSMNRCAQCSSTSHCTVWSLFITRTCLAHGSSFKDLCAKNILSSTRHVSFQTTFIPKPLSSQNHFHPKTTFIQNHFHPKSKTTFIPHPKPQPQHHTLEPLNPKPKP